MGGRGPSLATTPVSLAGRRPRFAGPGSKTPWLIFAVLGVILLVVIAVIGLPAIDHGNLSGAVLHVTAQTAASLY